MAINYELINKGGISLGTNFELLSEKPLDSRLVVPSLDGLQNYIDNAAAYEGMIAYVTSEKKHYEIKVIEGVLSYRPFGLTEAELNDIITNATTAAMEFKGATATLPENPAKGDMYKVAGENINIKIDDVDAKLGDSIVYDGAKWFLIPSGDDIEDTWRPVDGVNNDATLKFVNGDKTVAAVAADGTIKYNHATVDAPELLAENEQTRTYITAVETDGYGHITGYKTATENVEDTNTTYEFEGQAEESSVYFQVTSSEEGATAEVVYLDAYSKNEADGKFVEKVEGKQLSTEDFTTALLNKLNGIADEANKYEHATHTAYAEGFYKVTVDAEGHVSAAAAVTKDDIVALGIPGQDTTYEKAASEVDGLMSKEHFAKVEGIAEGATKVENVGDGKIKINDQEVTVYAHPDKHAIDDITGLQDALNGKAAEEHTHTKDEITDFAHTHTKSEITDFAHTHTASEITDFATEVAKVKVANAGNADSAKKVENALTVKVGGADVVFDGSAAKTADVDAAIEAAAAELIGSDNDNSSYDTIKGAKEYAVACSANLEERLTGVLDVLTVKHAEAADTATKATQDANGNVIADTYETKKDAKANKEAIAILKGADTVEGSVAKTVKDALADYTAALLHNSENREDDIVVAEADVAQFAVKDEQGNVINTTYETKGDAADKLTEAKGYADALLTWGEF